MGAYDQLLPSSGQYISTYRGLPIEETAALGETITKNFERGMAGVSAYNVMRDNVSVLNKDSDMKNAIFDKSYKEIQEYAKNGDYENALPAIMKATSMVSGNQELKSARASKAAADKFAVDIQDSDAEQWLKDLAISRLGGYQGATAGDNITKYMKMPAKSVNLNDIALAAGKAVRVTTTRGEIVPDYQTGKFKREIREEYDVDELDFVITNALMQPESAEYIKEYNEAFGEEQTTEMLRNIKVSTIATYNNVTPDTEWITPGKGFGSGSEAGTNQALGTRILPASKSKDSLEIVNTEADEILRDIIKIDQSSGEVKINEDSGMIDTIMNTNNLSKQNWDGLKQEDKI